MTTLRVVLCLALSGCTLGTSMALGDGVREANRTMERSLAPQRVVRCRRTYWGAVECREDWR